jgi:hypothetical protein
MARRAQAIGDYQGTETCGERNAAVIWIAGWSGGQAAGERDGTKTSKNQTNSERHKCSSRSLSLVNYIVLYIIRRDRRKPAVQMCFCARGWLVGLLGQDRPATSVWDGVHYTTDQAVRSEPAYRDACAFLPRREA